MKVSIITVAYNSQDCIGRSIESVLAQTVQAAEYWIIDGNSSDRTVEIAESYRKALEDKGVEYHVVSEPDQGIYDAMNKGIRLAGGDIIGILNTDDTYEAEAIETVVNTFEEQGCDLMFADICIWKQDGSSFIKKAKIGRPETSRHWNHPTTFVRAELYKEFPFRNLGIHDDYGFYLQMKKQGRRIVTVNKVLANFKMGGASNKKSLKAACRRIRDRYQYCYRINGYSRWYLVECVLIEGVKLVLG